MRQQLWRFGKITVGSLLLVLGVIGLFLPFLQGILFLIMGLSLLSTESPRAKAWLHHLEKRAGLRWLARDAEERRLDDA